MNTREKNKITTWFLIALVLSSVFIGYLYFSIYPKIVEIEEKKVSLRENIDYYNNILVKKWLDFNWYKKAFKISWNSSNWTLIDEKSKAENIETLPKIDKVFYDFMIYNGDYKNFKVDNFEKHLEKEYLKIQNTNFRDELNKQKRELSLVLPKYSSYIDLHTEDGWNELGLTNLRFVNYIEALLYRFRLKTESEIWIGKIELIEWWKNIYYIPLELELRWNQFRIIEFLEYIKNTWKVNFAFEEKISEEKILEDDSDKDSDEIKWDYKIKFIKEDFSISDRKDKRMSAFLEKEWVYQISEITSMEVEEYFSSNIEKEWVTLSELILSEADKRNYIDVKLELRFYVNWVGIDEIRNRISSIIWENNEKIKTDDLWDYVKNENNKWEYVLLHYNYKNILNLAEKLKGELKVQKTKYFKEKVDVIYSYLTNENLIKNIASINKEIKSWKDLTPAYKKVLKYREIFISLDKEIYSVVDELGLNKKNTYYQIGDTYEEWNIYNKEVGEAVYEEWYEEDDKNINKEWYLILKIKEKGFYLDNYELVFEKEEEIQEVDNEDEE